MNTVILPAIGTFVHGGFFAGALRVDGQRIGIVIAPKAQGEIAGKEWGKYRSLIAGADSFHDGRTNTRDMLAAELDLGIWTAGLNINGFADWYLPARDELELLYRAFKPTAEENVTWRGDNPSSDPVGYLYTVQTPAQTLVEAFREGGPEAMADELYWSSTQYSARSAWCQSFDVGNQYYFTRNDELRARAVRRFVIE